MNGDFKHLTNKEKIIKVLLACLGWGSATKWTDDIELKIQKRLKVQYHFDPIRIRSCIDLIEDTESAIVSFMTYGLKKFSSKTDHDFGEMYIRLYGVLNAVQLQKLAIYEIFETLKLADKNSVKKKLGCLKIFEIRNVVGAHTINFIDDAEYLPENFNKNFFRITQCKLTPKGDDIDAVDGFHNIRNFNLYESMIEYNQCSEKILMDGICEYLDHIFKNAQHIKTDFLVHYEIDSFIPFDYRKLYKNDILLSKYREKINKSLEKELKAEYGEDWKEIISTKINCMTMEELDLITRIEIDKFKNTK